MDKHDIGCVLALIHTPVVDLSDLFNNSLKKWV